MNDIKQHIKEIFVQTLENNQATDETYEKYFSKDYIQYVDGKKLDYHGFVSHMKALKEVMESMQVTFKHIVAEDDKVVTLHRVEGVKKTGEIIQAEVIALFQFKDNKIVLCDELTRLTKGDRSDADLGSRH